MIKLVGGRDVYAARPFLIYWPPLRAGRWNLGYSTSNCCFSYFFSNLEVLMRLCERDFQLPGLGLMNSLLIVVAGAAIGWKAALMASLRHIRAIKPYTS